MRENISSTGGLIPPPYLLCSSHHLAASFLVMRCVCNLMSRSLQKKLRNFRLPDGCFFSLFFQLFPGCSVSHSGNTLPVFLARTRPAALTRKCRAKHARKCRITFYYFVGSVFPESSPLPTRACMRLKGRWFRKYAKIRARVHAGCKYPAQARKGNARLQKPTAGRRKFGVLAWNAKNRKPYPLRILTGVCFSSDLAEEFLSPH